LSRTRVLPGEGEDDAVPLVQDGKHSTADPDEDDEDAIAPAPVPIRADRK